MRATVLLKKAAIPTIMAWAVLCGPGARAFAAAEGDAQMTADPTAAAGLGEAAAPSLEELARRYEKIHQYSVLFTAQDVQEYLAPAAGLEQAVEWCRRSGIRRVFLDTYRKGFAPDRAVCLRARDRFRAAGIEASGCVTPTQIGTPGEPEERHNVCYSAEKTHRDIAKVLADTASLFDEIIIDDFLFTKCACQRCDAARKGRDWAQFRCDLMLDVSRDHILAPARKANPKVRVIIKYPNWYDGYRRLGYDVTRQTALYPAIWVGTETREPNDMRWGGIQQYGGFFLMRWLGAVGGEKTGGGWFDQIDTGPDAYVEQARQTVLGGAAESMLYRYDSLIQGQGKAGHDRLRAEMPGLFALAEAIRGKEPGGIAAPKPDVDHREDNRVFDFVGMIGLPLVPMKEVPRPGEPGAVFLSAHWAHDAELPAKVAALRRAGTTILMTDTLAAALNGRADLTGVVTLPAGEKRRELPDLDQATLDALRARVLPAVRMGFRAPGRVAIYPFGDDRMAVENFNDATAAVRLSIEGWPGADVALTLGRDDGPALTAADGWIALDLPPRTLILLRRSGGE